jgi:hypothetical protein
MTLTRREISQFENIDAFYSFNIMYLGDEVLCVRNM